MLSIKNHILKLIRENLFLDSEYRNKLRSVCEDAHFLTRKGHFIIQMLTAANAQESIIFHEILKKDPRFFRDIKQRNLRNKLKNRRSEELKLQQRETEILENMLDNEFANLAL